MFEKIKILEKRFSEFKTNETTRKSAIELMEFCVDLLKQNADTGDNPEAGQRIMTIIKKGCLPLLKW